LHPARNSSARVKYILRYGGLCDLYCRDPQPLLVWLSNNYKGVNFGQTILGRRGLRRRRRNPIARPLVQRARPAKRPEAAWSLSGPILSDQPSVASHLRGVHVFACALLLGLLPGAPVFDSRQFQGESGIRLGHLQIRFDPFSRTRALLGEGVRPRTAFPSLGAYRELGQCLAFLNAGSSCISARPPLRRPDRPGQWHPINHLLVFRVLNGALVPLRDRSRSTGSKTSRQEKKKGSRWSAAPEILTSSVARAPVRRLLTDKDKKKKKKSRRVLVQL